MVAMGTGCGVFSVRHKLIVERGIEMGNWIDYSRDVGIWVRPMEMEIERG